MRKKILYGSAVKIIAAVLSGICFLVSIGGTLFSLYCMDQGLYKMDRWNYYETEALREQFYCDVNAAVYEYFAYYQDYQWRQQINKAKGDGVLSSNELDQLGYAALDMDVSDENLAYMKDTLQYTYEEWFEPEDTSFRFDLYIKNQRSPISTYRGDKENYGYEETLTYIVYSPNGEEAQEVIVHACVTDPLVGKDAYYNGMQGLYRIYEYRNQILWITAGAAGLWLILLVYLLCAAGYKRGSQQPVAGGLHRFPFDLLTGCVAAAEGLMLAFICGGGISKNPESILAGGLAVVCGYAIGLVYLVSFTVRCKTHTLWKNTVIGVVLRWSKKTGLLIYRNMSFLWKSITLLSGGYLITMAAGAVIGDSGEEILAFWVYLTILFGLLLALAISFQLQYHKIQKGISRIASGETGVVVDTKDLHGELRRQAENLNQIQSAVQIAVEERMKSERLKTELITNVSHDIKTPLTSIVNYVDLLKKQNIQDAACKEYIEVLDRQSKRLKKLIEDLIEASKASSGSISVNMAKLDTTELLKQMAGEYEDRLKEQGLETVLNTPEEEVFVIADGQLLWRVFDNLLSNAQKYSQPGTRVYLDLWSDQEYVYITFRNISKYQLNISGDELMERFVRGDSSRHTEGSGLGLSIARSLTDLMNGHFQITVDGDLFKVQVTFFRLQQR